MESIFIVVVIVVMLVMMWLSTRNAKKQQNEARAFRSKLRVGDKVMTGAGLIGEVAEIDEAAGQVVINSEGYETRWVIEAVNKRPGATESIVDSDPVEKKANKAIDAALADVVIEEVEVEVEEAPAAKPAAKKTASTAKKTGATAKKTTTAKKPAGKTATKKK
jgi:preprotein translocase YajC subunit